jgi:dihydromethanopterin reductase (acceptor)
MRVAWGLDGAGHLLAECVEVLSGLPSADLYMSRSGEEVLSLYNLKEKINNAPTLTIIPPQGLTFFSAGKFARREYDLLILAPASSNSVAKFVYGISDSLTTNLFAAAGKSRVDIVVLPTDTAEEIDSFSPSGWVKVFPRRIDLENVSRLASFEGVTVVEAVAELERVLREK